MTSGGPLGTAAAVVAAVAAAANDDAVLAEAPAPPNSEDEAVGVAAMVPKAGGEADWDGVSEANAGAPSAPPKWDWGGEAAAAHACPTVPALTVVVPKEGAGAVEPTAGTGCA